MFDSIGRGDQDSLVESISDFNRRSEMEVCDRSRFELCHLTRIHVVRLSRILSVDGYPSIDWY